MAEPSLITQVKSSSLKFTQSKNYLVTFNSGREAKMGIDQGCQTQFLEGHSPALFRYNPN